MVKEDQRKIIGWRPKGEPKPKAPTEADIIRRQLEEQRDRFAVLNEAAVDADDQPAPAWPTGLTPEQLADVALGGVSGRRAIPRSAPR